MTIRYLLCITAVAAFGFAILPWNLGVAMLLLAAIPMGALLALPRPLSRRMRWMRGIALSFASAPIYFLSFAPYLATYRVAYGDRPAPPWIAMFTTTVYAPHFYLLYNATTKTHFLRFFTPHYSAWNDVVESLTLQTSASETKPLS